METRFVYSNSEEFELGTSDGNGFVLCFRNNGKWFDRWGNEPKNVFRHRSKLPVEIIRTLFPEVTFIEEPAKPTYPTRSRKMNTHAVVAKDSGVQIGEGTEDQCKAWIYEEPDFRIVQLTD